MTSLAAITSARSRAIDIRSGSIRRATRSRVGALAVGQRDEVEFGLDAGPRRRRPRSVARLVGPGRRRRAARAACRRGGRGRGGGSGGHGHDRRRVAAPRGNGRVVTVAEPRWYGHRTALRRTGPPPPPGRTSPDARTCCGTMGPTTPNRTRSKENPRCPPSDAPRPPGPAPSPPVPGPCPAVSSGAFTDLPVTWAARTESPDGKTSPEELRRRRPCVVLRDGLLRRLGRAGTPPERLDVSAEVTFDKLEPGWRVVSSALTVRGVVPGMSRRRFRGGRRGDQGRLPDQPWPWPATSR